VLLLIALAIGVFLLPAWWMVGAAAVVVAGLWLWAGLGARALARQLSKLAPLGVLIVAGYALFAVDPATDRWVVIGFGWAEVEINASGAIEGVAMWLRVLAVVMASQLARAGDPRAIAAGLRGIGMPRIAAVAVDAVLDLMGGRGRGRGDGSGKGMGGGKGSDPEGGGFLNAFKKLARGDVGALAGAVRRHIGRVEQHLAERDPELSPEAMRDAAVIAGVALTMLGIKILKLLPGVPFAPGHKGVLLIPLYLVAAQMTRTRAGATLTGLVMGIVAFLMGDGRYGVFEIAKHVAPGVVIDLLYVPTRGLARASRVVAWSLLGLIAALGRYATITAIALAVQPPAIVYAVLLPGLIVHAIFGVLSGLVTAPLLAALEKEQP
jgi:energy-coupling factor transporter transmembrane protein EcfT